MQMAQFFDLNNQMLCVIGTLVNWHLGAAIYVIPYQFVSNGILPTLFGLALAAIMTYFVYWLLIQSSDRAGVNSFSGLVSSVMGPLGGKVLSVLVILNAVGVFTAYFDILQTAVLQVHLGIEWLDWTIQTSLLLAVVVGCYASNAWDISWANNIANFALVVLWVGILMLLFNQSSDTTEEIQFQWDNNLNNDVISRTLKASTISIFAFSSAEIILQTRAELHRNNFMLRAGAWSIIISFFIYCAVGIFGSYLNNVPEDILSSFIGRGMLGWVVLLTNFASIALSIPIFIITARKYFSSLVFGTEESHAWRNFLLTSFLLMFSLFFRHLSSHLIALIEFVSGITDGLFMLVFPTIVALCHLPNLTNYLKVINTIMLLYGLAQFGMTLAAVAGLL
jgi:amino acid permease